MKKWILKAIVQKFISFLPNGHQINYLFQKYITKGNTINDTLFNDRFRHAVDHIYYYHKFNNKLPDTTLELGTGWVPIVPIYFFLCGINNIYTIDINHHLKKQKLKDLIRYYIDYFQTQNLQNFEFVKSEKLDDLKKIFDDFDNLDLSSILMKLNIYYQLMDATKMSFNTASFDLIHSNNTFEHIYPNVLIGIIKEMKRVLTNEGIMSHVIDMSDHFAHMDSTITIYNFLKFSDKQWSFIDNSIQPQNRLRKSEFINIYNDLNISIKEVIEFSDRKNDLNMDLINNKYKKFEFEDLAVSYLHLIS